MPRHVLKAETRSSRHPRLAKTLAQEIKRPGNDPQPLILEEEIPVTNSRHVQVIWEQWKTIPDEHRSEVILEAYAQAEGEAFANQIVIASGYTPVEAFALGLLPYKVVPVRASHSMKASAMMLPSDAEIEAAVQEEARNTVLGPRLSFKYGLRYARKEDAQSARDRLKASIAPPLRMEWKVQEDVPDEDS